MSSHTIKRTIWIFGYGSLIWRPNFSYLQKQRARIFGFERVFFQGSPDHRGSPQKPGRVVTLLKNTKAACEGVAFEIARSGSERIMAAMDQREIGGYIRRQMPAQLLGDCGHHPQRTLDAIWVYIATENNPHYLGPASPAKIAEEALHVEGTSGTNTEYILSLADALRGLDFSDSHVFQVEAALKKRISE